MKWEGRGGIIILPPAGLSAPLVLRSLPGGKDGAQEASNISLIERRLVCDHSGAKSVRVNPVFRFDPF